MKPYYQDEWVTLYHGDCLDVLPGLDPVGFAFADPPYNSGLKYGAGTDDKRADYWEWLAPRMGALVAAGERVVVKHSALKVVDFLSRYPSRMMVWYKPFSSGFPLHGLATHWEPMYLLKGAAVNWSKDVVVCSAGNAHKDGTQGHPAQFPEELARHLINTFTNPGDVVLDAFAGSGTVLRAAKDLNRRAIGMEIEERFCAMIARRLSQGVLDLGAA